MKLEEAIEGSEEAAIYLASHHQDRLVRSIRLGIEAMKQEVQRRKYLINSTGELLPGETED